MPLFQFNVNSVIPEHIMLLPSTAATCLPRGSGDSLVICLAADSTESVPSFVEYASCLAGVSETMNKN